MMGTEGRPRSFSRCDRPFLPVVAGFRADHVTVGCGRGLGKVTRSHRCGCLCGRCASAAAINNSGGKTLAQPKHRRWIHQTPPIALLMPRRFPPKIELMVCSFPCDLANDQPNSAFLDRYCPDQVGQAPNPTTRLKTRRREKSKAKVAWMEFVTVSHHRKRQPLRRH
jgi:hypothetical protein